MERKKELIVEALERAGIDPGRRGETLSVEEFAKLSNELYEDFFAESNKSEFVSIFSTEFLFH